MYQKCKIYKLLKKERNKLKKKNEHFYTLLYTFNEKNTHNQHKHTMRYTVH